ncbi:excise [Mycobacterium phage TarsusIV]|uniref:Excise n=1 Tax=Mycobacterium phage Heffalump TaxID=1983575 RepID=A0A220NSD9_9CAUD|nr:excisionase family DNA-binding protein [Mycobacterium phage Heffalump]ASJ79734.1 excise [Mycobacterium phage Heffalump]QTF81461.1 excise [Mycobacterium phage TarsusIV]
MPPRASIAETAEYLGVHPNTVRNYIAEGKLKAVRLGPRLIRVERDSVEALMRPIGK